MNLYFHPFVLPFSAGVIFLFVAIVYKFVIWLIQMPTEEKHKLRRAIFTRHSLGAIEDVIRESLFHRKIFATNTMLGYMHMSLALGWFLLIIVGWLETSAYLKDVLTLPYVDIFFRYFFPDEIERFEHNFNYAFIMDALLLFILSGVLIAYSKRIYSRIVGLRKTTKHTTGDRVALTALWLIFPLRLLAESATCGLHDSGSFLTNNTGHFMASFLPLEHLELPLWWSYSIALGIFFVALPFSRYLHIFAEIPHIFLKNYDIRSRDTQSSIDKFQIAACSRCGICIDPCQMQSVLGVTDMQAVYYLRDRRYGMLKQSTVDNCLMCGRCEQACPVGIDLNTLRLNARTATCKSSSDYSYLVSADLSSETASESSGARQATSTDLPANTEKFAPTNQVKVPDPSTEHKAEHEDAELGKTGLGNTGYGKTGYGKTGYFAGCMTHLSPRIESSMREIFEAAGEDIWYADSDGGVCCGRPMKLSGDLQSANKMIEYNKKLFYDHKIDTLVTSCPICLKVFKEDYHLQGVKILHHSQYISELMDAKRLTVVAGQTVMTYHDPCELGRGSGIFEAPRRVVSSIGTLVEPAKTGRKSLCCGSSLANTVMKYDDARKISSSASQQFEATGAQQLITSCPMCKRAFTTTSKIAVLDIAEVVAASLKK